MACAKTRASSGLDALFAVAAQEKMLGTNREHLRDFPMHQWVCRVLLRLVPCLAVAISWLAPRPMFTREIDPLCARIALLSIQKFLQKSTGSAGLWNQHVWPIFKFTKRKLPSTSPPLEQEPTGK